VRPPLDDCLCALQATIPRPTRSSPHCCLQRYGIDRLLDVAVDKPTNMKSKSYPIGFFHIDIPEGQSAEGKPYLFAAIDRTSKVAFVQLVEKADRNYRSDQRTLARSILDERKSELDKSELGLHYSI
jgi:hypothetical protein